MYNLYMTDEISFNEEHTHITSLPAHSGLIGFLINKCGVKTEVAANVILVLLSVVMLGFTALILKNALS